MRVWPRRGRAVGRRIAFAAVVCVMAHFAENAAGLDPRNIESGSEIPSEGYVDQPYVVVLGDGTWLCTLTTGPGEEGNDQQHVVATRSEDKGRTWSPLIDIEPHGPPESSWVTPLVVSTGAGIAFPSPAGVNMAATLGAKTASSSARQDHLSENRITGAELEAATDHRDHVSPVPLSKGASSLGRVYAFYVYNADNLREVTASTDYARRRVDTLGEYVFRYSDDGGRTWSAERYTIPIQAFDIDRENPYGGGVRFFWGVGKPMIHNGVAYIGLAKVGSFGEGFIERSEGFLLRSDNILTESDPKKIRWETLPDGDVGLRAPVGPIAEEHNLVSLSDGGLYCTYRTVDGHPCHAYSRDDGHTWTAPAYMTYEPDGRMMKHPRAANFVRKFSNGKYLYWFHNHGGRSYEGRNPAWLCGGVEREGRIHWSEPEIVLYADDPKTRMSYPDFIEDDGRIYITETQKSIARVHPIEQDLLDGLWNQASNRSIAGDGLAVDLYPQDLREPVMLNVGISPEEGFSIELAFVPTDLAAELPLIETQDVDGYGWAVTWHGSEGIQLTLDSPGGTWSCGSDPLSDPAWKRQHVVLSFDPASGLVTFVLNGHLCDGGDARTQGWYRVPEEHRPCPGIQDLAVVPLVHGEVRKLRVYRRYVRTSEAVGNWRADEVLATEGTPDDD